MLSTFVPFPLWAQWGQAPLRPRGQVLAEVVKGFLQLAVFGLGEAGFLAVYLIAVQVLLMLGLCQRLCAMGAKCQALLRPFHCSEKSDRTVRHLLKGLKLIFRHLSHVLSKSP